MRTKQRDRGEVNINVRAALPRRKEPISPVQVRRRIAMADAFPTTREEGSGKVGYSNSDDRQYLNWV